MPRKASGLLEVLGGSGFMVLILMGVIFLIVGMLMDIVAAALMLIPVLMPSAVQAGVHPMHFLIFMSASLAIGLATHPQVDMVSFTGSTRAGTAVAAAAGV